MPGNEETTSPPLNSHASTAQAQQRNENMMMMMMQQIQKLADQVAELSKRRDESTVIDEADPIASPPARSTAAQPRRATHSHDGDHDVDDDETLSYATSTTRPSAKLPIKPPSRFTLVLDKGQNLIDKVDELGVFLEKLEAYHESFESSNNVTLSLNEKIAHLTSIVDDDVFTSIKAVRNRLIASNERIDSIERLFEDIVVLCQGSEMQTVVQLDEIKQAADETVEAYFMRFDKLHGRAVRGGIANRNVSVLWFVNGLKPSVRRQVKLAMNVNGLIQDSASVKQALNKCFVAAKAFEADSLLDERGAWRSRPNQSNNQSANHSSQSRISKGADVAPLSRDEKIKLIMKKHSMTAAEVERHWTNNLCFACHANNHTASDGGCPKRKGKLNTTSVESVDESMNDVGQSKNQ